MQAYLSPQDCDLEQFSKQVERQLTVQNVPQAHDIQNNVPIYDISQLDMKVTPKHFGQNGLMFYATPQVSWFLKMPMQTPAP